jgi:uncharacterized protein
MSLIRRHPVITFFLLACALSWAAIPWQSFFAPGVLVAALVVVSLTEGVAGVKAMGSRLIRCGSAGCGMCSRSRCRWRSRSSQ